MGIFELAMACRLRARVGGVRCFAIAWRGGKDHRRAAADAIATVCDFGKTAFRFNEGG